MTSTHQHYKGFKPFKMDPKFRVAIPSAWRPEAGASLFLLFSKEHEMPVVKVLSQQAYDEKVELIKGSDKTPAEKGKMLGKLAMLRYWWQSKPGPWARDLSVPAGPKPPASTAVGELRITLVNHATVLIQVDGLNLLTDPIWSARASPVSWAGPQRFRPPAIRFEDLPRIDVRVIGGRVELAVEALR